MMVRSAQSLLLFSVAWSSSGCPHASTASSITVTELETVVIEANGSTTSQNVVGTRRIAIQIDPGTHTLQPDGGGVQVTYWFPGGLETTGAANVRTGEATTYEFDLPGSGDLEICERMLYRWSIVYVNADTASNGLYLGAERTVSPTTEVDGNQIRQSLCAE